MVGTSICVRIRELSSIDRAEGKAGQAHGADYQTVRSRGY